MKVGDLVQMKYKSFWDKKGARFGIAYTEVPFIVMEVYANAIKVMLLNGSLATDLAEYYEVVNESR